MTMAMCSICYVALESQHIGHQMISGAGGEAVGTIAVRPSPIVSRYVA
jgi:hypothetical protein